MTIILRPRHEPVYDTTSCWPTSANSTPPITAPAGTSFNEGTVRVRIDQIQVGTGADLDAHMEQEARESTWRRFQGRASVVRTFSPERVVERPERHARSNPRRE